MHFIRFDAERKGEIDSLNAEWRRSRREEAGAVLTVDVQEVWGTPIGMTLSRMYPADFIGFLKSKGFPFKPE
ncbi:hypothetical protein UP09_14180 [Bradyrhizobium sp. LTSP885]|nr:hypothetical protein UP09_14180 [Bradyrhizobium sp. LTSP885]